MARATRSLAVAASSYRNSNENRLTELYATVLDQHDGFAASVLAHVELPVAEELAAFTREGLGDDGQIDLVLRARDAAGKPVAILYAEHKEPHGSWQDGQPGKYLRALRREMRGGAQGRLLVVVGAKRDLRGRARKRARMRSAEEDVAAAAELREETGSEQIVFTTWHELGGWADDVGRAELGNDWLERAFAPDALARQRLLAELVSYLEEAGYTMTKPLSAEQLALFSEAETLYTTLNQLIVGAIELLEDKRIAGYEIRKPARASSADDDLSQRIVPPSGSWVERWDGVIYMNFQPADPGGDPPSSAPEFAITVELGRNEARALDRRTALRQQVQAASLRLDIDDDAAYCWTSMPADKLMGMQTLSEQTTELASWARESIEKLLKLKPGPRPSRRRR